MINNNEIGLEALKKPDLLQIITSDMRYLGFKGAYEELLLLYLTVISRLNNRGLYTFIICKSGERIKKIMDDMVKLINPDESFVIGGLAANSHYQSLNLKDKCLLIKNLDKNKLLVSYLKKRHISQLRQEEVTEKKRGLKKEYNLDGSFIVLSDKEMNESLNCFFYTVREKETKAFKSIFKSSNLKCGLLEKHHAIQKSLIKRITCIPDLYIKKMKFPAEQLRNRWDHKRFLDLILTVCFLRQYQKEVIRTVNGEYILTDIIDYETAYKIFTHCCRQDKTFNQGLLTRISPPSVIKRIIVKA